VLDRLAALPKIGCGTLILALISGWCSPRPTERPSTREA
jgi:hypothetical protein